MKKEKISRIALIRPQFGIKREPMGLNLIVNDLKTDFYVKLINNSIENHSPVSLLKYIIAKKINAVGISLFDGVDNSWTKQFIKLARKFKKDLVIVLGGDGPTFGTELFIKNFKPDFIVCGHGEGTFKQLLKSDFNTKGFENIDGTFVVNSKCTLDLNDLCHIRNYDINHYRTVVVDGNRGCFGKCIYCDPTSFVNDQVVVYKTPEKIYEEIVYLKENLKDSNKKIKLGGGNFLANPQKATETIKYLNEKGVKGLNIGLSARLDQLKYLLLKPNSSVWQEFASNNELYIEMGVETYNEKALVKIRKKSRVSGSEKYSQFNQLERILNMFPKISFLIDLIPFHPWTEHDVLREDYAFVNKLLQNHNNFIVDKADLVNRLIIFDSNKNDFGLEKGGKYFKDPITDFLHYILYNKNVHEFIYKLLEIIVYKKFGSAIVKGQESKEFVMGTLTFYLSIIEEIKSYYLDDLKIKGNRYLTTKEMDYFFYKYTGRCINKYFPENENKFI